MEANEYKEIICHIVGLDPEELTEIYCDEFVLNQRYEIEGYTSEEAISLIEELRQYLKAAFLKGKLPIGLGNPDKWTVEQLTKDYDEIHKLKDPPEDWRIEVNKIIKELYPITLTSFTLEEMLGAWHEVSKTYPSFYNGKHNLKQAFNNDPKVDDTKQTVKRHDGVYVIYSDEQAYEVAYERARDYYQDHINEEIPGEFESWVDYDGYVQDMCTDLDIDEWIYSDSMSVWSGEDKVGQYWWIVKTE